MNFLLYLGLGAAAYYVLQRSAPDCFVELPPVERELADSAMKAMRPGMETELDRESVLRLAEHFDTQGFPSSADCLRAVLARVP